MYVSYDTSKRPDIWPFDALISSNSTLIIFSFLYTLYFLLCYPNVYAYASSPGWDTRSSTTYGVYWDVLYNG